MTDLRDIVRLSVVNTALRLLRATLALPSEPGDDAPQEFVDNVVSFPRCFVCDDAGCEFCPEPPKAS
jgi:hypothetical protein